MKNKNLIIILLFFLVGAKFFSAIPWQVSKMSWYGESFFSKETTSGEIYNSTDLTFAHNKLPFGTLVEFKYKSVLVIAKCNDRGDFDKYGREFDLSYRVAEMLGLLEIGVTNVKWRIIY